MYLCLVWFSILYIWSIVSACGCIVYVLASLFIPSCSWLVMWWYFQFDFKTNRAGCCRQNSPSSTITNKQTADKEHTSIHKDTETDTKTHTQARNRKYLVWRKYVCSNTQLKLENEQCKHGQLPKDDILKNDATERRHWLNENKIQLKNERQEGKKTGKRRGEKNGKT